VPVREQGPGADPVDPQRAIFGLGMSSNTSIRLRTGLDQNPSIDQPPSFSRNRAASNERRRLTPSRTLISRSEP
jgi:hypothetical protein